MRPASARPNQRLHQLLVVTEMTGGRFLRIRSAAAANCAGAPQAARFSHGLGPELNNARAAAVSAVCGKPDAARSLG